MWARAPPLHEPGPPSAGDNELGPLISSGAPGVPRLLDLSRGPPTPSFLACLCRPLCRDAEKRVRGEERQPPQGPELVCGREGSGGSRGPGCRAGRVLSPERLGGLSSSEARPADSSRRWQRLEGKEGFAGTGGGEPASCGNGEPRPGR